MTIATLTSGQSVTPVDRETWLAARVESIGASEAAAACGVSPYQTPLDLYARKLGLSPPVEETMAMRLGTLLEPVIATLYQQDTGAEIARQQVYARSLERPHLSATIDAITTDGTIVEFKTLGSRLAGLLGDEGSDEIPDHWILQATQQAYVAETAGCLPGVDPTRVEFAVLVAGQDFRRFTVRVDEALLASMLLKLDQFWDHVQRREPPPVSRPGDAGIYHLLHPRDDGPTIDGDADLADLVVRYANLGGVLKANEDDRGLVKARILERMGEAAVARFADGFSVRRRVIERAETTIVQRACSYSQLYVSKPKKGR